MLSVRSVPRVVLVPLALSGLTGWAGADDRRERDGRTNAFEHVHALAMGADARALWLGAHGGLFRSADGGRTWQRLTVSAMHRSVDAVGSWKPMGKDLRNMAAVAVNPRRPEEVYAGTEDGTIYRSTDGGRTWMAGR
jgi:hypothetical protein